MRKGRADILEVLSVYKLPWRHKWTVWPEGQSYLSDLASVMEESYLGRPRPRQSIHSHYHRTKRRSVIKMRRGDSLGRNTTEIVAEVMGGSLHSIYPYGWSPLPHPPTPTSTLSRRLGDRLLLGRWENVRSDGTSLTNTYIS